MIRIIAIIDSQRNISRSKKQQDQNTINAKFHFVKILRKKNQYKLKLKNKSERHTIITLAKCAAIRVYTPPAAPARKEVGSVIEEPKDPAIQPHKYNSPIRHLQV